MPDQDQAATHPASTNPDLAIAKEATVMTDTKTEPRLTWTDEDGDTWSEPIPTAEALSEALGNHYGTWRAESQTWDDVAVVVRSLLDSVTTSRH